MLEVVESTLYGYKVDEVCLRWLRCATGRSEVSEVCLRWLRHTLGKSAVTEV
jgi:hypothetical protein